MSVLTPETVQERLRSLPQWKLEGKEIVRQYEFADFAAAMVFVNQVAEKAENAGHPLQQGQAGFGFPRQRRSYGAGHEDGTDD
jgi:hypothetical protein